MATQQPDSDQPVFYYDLGHPDCYLVAERIMGELPVVPEWEPVLARDLAPVDTTPDVEAFTRRAAELELLAVRWPAVWPPDTERAMLVATYAKHIGRAVAFSQAAFRQVFAGGRDLSDDATILIAAAACEMHPTAILKAIGLRSVTRGLPAATERARQDGVTALPAIALPRGALHQGPDALAQATAALGRKSRVGT